MERFIIFVFVIVVFGLLPKILKYLANQQAGGEEKEKERSASERLGLPSGKDPDQVQEFLQQMGLRIKERHEQQQQQAQRPGQPRPQPPQPQPDAQPAARQEFVHKAVSQRATHGAAQKVDQRAATGPAKPAQAPDQAPEPTPKRPRKPKPEVTLQPVEALKAPPLLQVESVAAPAREAADPMAKPELQKLSPAQRAIVLAEILGGPRSTRPYEDLPSRWV